MIDTAKLKEKILDLAIRGKLVPQDPSDEPASVLLEKIRAEKLQMVKDGKLKQKDIKDDTVIFVGEDNLHYEKFADGSIKCIEDEIPFEIPKSWAWCRLGILAQYKKGPFGSSITKSMFVPESSNTIKVYEQKNAINKNANLGNYFISNEKFQELKSFEVFPNDIIVSCAGTIGETFVMPQNMKKGIINQALMKITLFDLRLLDFYLIYFDCKLKQSANEQGYGVALKNIPPFDILKKYLMPIPPLNEQSKIINVLNNYANQLDVVNINRDNLLESINSLKSKILDLAIRGKLVPQDPNDEPADVLLERIRKEKEELIKQGKIKRDKKDSIIFKGDDNSYYEKMDTKVKLIDDFEDDLPAQWNLCRFGSIANIFTGNSINEEEKASKYTNLKEGFNYIGTKDIGFNNIINYNNGVKIPFNTDFKIAPTNTPLLCIEGGSAGRKIAITSEDVCFGNKLCAFQSLGVLPKYLYYYLQTPQFLQLFQTNTTGLIGGVSINTIKQLYFKAPPIQEQSRIVNAIEKIFININTIEKSLS